MILIRGQWGRVMDEIFWIGIGLLLIGLALCWRNKGSYGVPLILTSAVLLFVFVLISGVQMAFARDDGRWAQSNLKSWFDGLQSAKGACCSDADGSALSGGDWESRDGRYRVRIDGQWYDVPDDALLKQPNLYGRTVVWPRYSTGIDGKPFVLEIRCFIPGVMM